jgi:arginase
MKTIRLLHPDYIGGGLETYYFGAMLLQYILPQNDEQKLVRVNVVPPDGTKKEITQGIYGRPFIDQEIQNAEAVIEKEAPDRIITIGGSCLVSFAPFDYLHGKYENTGLLWVDAHPDVSMKENGYPCAHAMVLGSLLGGGDSVMTQHMKNKPFNPKDILFVGLQGLHDYQEDFLNQHGVPHKIQDKAFLSLKEIKEFVCRYDHILVHFDIDVLDEHLFHSTYFANPDAGGDGAGGGKMTLEKLGEILTVIDENSRMEGLTVAEYLPFDEYKLYKTLSNLSIFH